MYVLRESCLVLGFMAHPSKGGNDVYLKFNTKSSTDSRYMPAYMYIVKGKESATFETYLQEGGRQWFLVPFPESATF